MSSTVSRDEKCLHIYIYAYMQKKKTKKKFFFVRAICQYCSRLSGFSTLRSCEKETFFSQPNADTIIDSNSGNNDQQHSKGEEKKEQTGRERKKLRSI